MELQELVTPKELAALLKISPSTLYNLVNRGVLPAIKIGKSVRFNPKHVQAAIEKMTYDK